MTRIRAIAHLLLIFAVASAGSAALAPTSRSALLPDIQGTAVSGSVTLNLGAGPSGTPQSRRQERPSLRPAMTASASPSRSSRPVAAASQKPRKTAAIQPRLSMAPSKAPVSKPTARSVNSLKGVASWFCLPGRSACTYGYPASCLCAAAGPALRAALGPSWRGTRVVVSTGRASVAVRLIDCLCSGSNVIDLYSGVYSQLGALSSGLLDVEVTW